MYQNVGAFLYVYMWRRKRAIMATYPFCCLVAIVPSHSDEWSSIDHLLYTSQIVVLYTFRFSRSLVFADYLTKKVRDLISWNVFLARVSSCN